MVDGLGWVAVVLKTVGKLFAPGVLPDTHSVNPLGVGGPLGAVFDALQAAFGFVLFTGLAALASLIFRYRRADPVEREQLRWLVYAVGLIILAVIAGSVVMELVRNGDLATNIQNAIVSFALSAVPLAIGFAVLKYRLYDIDIVISKTLVFGVLAAFITAVYVGIVVGIGALIDQGTGKPNLALSILATAVVAVAFQPVRERVQRFANRLVYGKRATPYEVLAEFSHRMAGTYGADDVLPRMARILGEGTGAKEARVWLAVSGELTPAAAWPDAQGNGQGSVPVVGRELPTVPGSDLATPVTHQGELLGALSITKSAGERLTPAEEKLTNDLASQAGLVLRNVRLIEELKASRVRLVQAQDQERRRIERNIHDGAQQQLVALGVKLGLARRLTDDPSKVDALLSDLQEETNQALQDLRDLARGIYPPLLADQGLVAALGAQARKAAIPVTVESDGIGRQPQDIEAAVYFCCLEALQNVAKYANATQATVRLEARGAYLAFEVADDGAGFDSTTLSYGTGLQGMADRLSALGGSLLVTSEPGVGTTVAGRLPISALEPVG